MSDKLSESKKWLERLIAFDTTSRLSNMELINAIQSYLTDININTRLTYNSEKSKAETIKLLKKVLTQALRKIRWMLVQSVTSKYL